VFTSAKGSKQIATFTVQQPKTANSLPYLLYISQRQQTACRIYISQRQQTACHIYISQRQQTACHIYISQRQQTACCRFVGREAACHTFTRHQRQQITVVNPLVTMNMQPADSEVQDANVIKYALANNKQQIVTGHRKRKLVIVIVVSMVLLKDIQGLFVQYSNGKSLIMTTRMLLVS